MKNSILIILLATISAIQTVPAIDNDTFANNSAFIIMIPKAGLWSFKLFK